MIGNEAGKQKKAGAPGPPARLIAVSLPEPALISKTRLQRESSLDSSSGGNAGSSGFVLRRKVTSLPEDEYSAGASG
ncbi:hypothetical protein N5T34_10130 [Escherichia coli]|uniref:hypothetical protein n=1 Tax=Escherichia coli TaxID=562 RepID=UPI002228142D|nr:hypothetical protein [Escherichia coli]MCW3299655.1 hypothetical protein [Escherichia coli]